MASKSFSVIIIPHSKENSKTVNISEKTIKILVGIFGTFFVLLVVFLIEYVSFVGIKRKYKDLTNESIKQRQTIVEYKVSVNKLRTTIEHMENYAKKLNVMAGLKSPDALKEVGIGGGSSVNSQEMGSGNIPRDATLGSVKSISQEAEGIEKNLSTLVSFFEDQRIKLAFTPSIAPTKGYLSSAYGWRNDPFTGQRSFHPGIDIATQTGNPVVATAEGIVIAVKTEKMGGKTIKISHRFGYQTVYCHLSKFLVKSGQRIKRGDVIGLVGRTGKAVGPHVHYEVVLNNKSVNPYYYLLEE